MAARLTNSLLFGFDHSVALMPKFWGINATTCTKPDNKMFVKLAAISSPKMLG